MYPVLNQQHGNDYIKLYKWQDSFIAAEWEKTAVIQNGELFTCKLLVHVAEELRMSHSYNTTYNRLFQWITF